MLARLRTVLKHKSQIAKILLIVIMTIVIILQLASTKTTTIEEFNYTDVGDGEEIDIIDKKKHNVPTTTKTVPYLRPRRRTVSPYKKEIRDMPVLKAEDPSIGQPWPMPLAMALEKNVLLVQGDILEFVIRGKSCEILERALKRHKKLFKQIFISTTLTSEENVEAIQRARRLPILTKVEVMVKQECTDYPHADMDEGYDLLLSEQSMLKANQVWGIIRGLETLHQLVHRSSNHSTRYSDTFVIKQGTVEDRPRFPHRGILIDSSRHFLKKETILQNIDAMSQVKFNVLHWHMVDDQSFPFESKVFPDLAFKGAYKDHRGNPVYYKQEDIKEIINFARDRGIRVIPEFDSPGHTESWQGGLADILSDCPLRVNIGPWTRGILGNRPGPINPTKEITFIKLKMLFTEIMQLFPEKYMHLGGDECSYFCWSENKQIADFMKENLMTKFEELFHYYERRLLNLINDIDEKAVPIVWQEVYDEGTKLPPKAIIHYWKSDMFSVPLKNLTAAGHKIIFSSCWYLNYVKYGTDWQLYYVCDPGIMNRGTGSENIIGGEACMWGEYVDDTNLLQYLWPRAIAVAERLWSAPQKLNFFEAPPRLEEQRCRFLRRGIPAAPHLGPEPPCI